MKRTKTGLALMSAFGFALSGLSATVQAPAQSNQAPASATGGVVRFAVAHMHMGGWCYGYLYVTGNQVRYEVVQPQTNRGHSFTADRLNVVAGHRRLFGQPAEDLKNFVNISVKGRSYNFLWLANEAEVNTGGAHRMSPPQAAPPDVLIATIQNPAAASPATAQDAGIPPAAPAPQTQPSPTQVSGQLGPANAPSARQAGMNNPVMAEAALPLPPGALQGVYVCLAGADLRPANKQFLFYPDGFMVYGIPQKGMLGFDFARYRSETNPEKNWVGRYRVDGDKVKIVWQNQFGDPANPAVIKLDEKSAYPAVDPGWEVFIPTCHCTGKRFSGKYLWGPPAADQYMQFFADGTFTDHRVTDQMFVPNNFYEHPRIQQGTYSIQSQTMVFSFADGHRGTRTFVVPKVQQNDAMFQWIGLGWQRLFEEHYVSQLAQ